MNEEPLPVDIEIPYEIAQGLLELLHHGTLKEAPKNVPVLLRENWICLEEVATLVQDEMDLQGMLQARHFRD